MRGILKDESVKRDCVFLSFLLLSCKMRNCSVIAEALRCSRLYEKYPRMVCRVAGRKRREGRENKNKKESFFLRTAYEP